MNKMNSIKTEEEFFQNQNQDDEGCYYTLYEDYLTTGVCEFCGCGCPDEALKYVAEALKLVAWRKDYVWAKDISKKEMDKRFHEWQTACKNVFGSTGAEYFMWYWLDNQGLTQHGSSVPGWLTDKGEKLLVNINLLNNER